MNAVSSKPIIYLIGTGRSGTTILSTILGNHPDIQTVGEINLFYKEICQKRKYSKIWNCVFSKINKQTVQYDKAHSYIYKKERHFQSLKYGTKFFYREDKKYKEYTENVIHAISTCTNKQYLLDSSKYVARGILLKKTVPNRIKYINLVRDPRGLIHSFNKKVQTSSPPLKTIIYYWIINLLVLYAKHLVLGKKQVLTVRYEDLISNTRKCLLKIENHLDISMKTVADGIEMNDPFDVPDIIGGNRIKQKITIKLKPDLEWKKVMPRHKQWLYYFLTLPLNLIFRYNP